MTTLPLLSTVTSLLDFVEPAFILRHGGQTKSFQINQISTYSNSSVSVKLEISNTSMVIDRNLIFEIPVAVQVNGTSSTGIALLQDGAFSLRSHAIAKCISNLNINYGSVSVNFSSSDVISAMERYSSMDCSKYQTDFAEPYLDMTQDYSDLLGSNRNPMNLYSAGIGSQVHRGAGGQISNVVNPVAGVGVPNTATFNMVLRGCLITPPLLDQILKNGTSYGLTNLNNLNIDISFVSNLGARMFSFMPRRNGDVLTLTSVNVNILQQPLFRFVQIMPEMPVMRPIIYSLQNNERYPTNFTFMNQLQQVPSQVVQLSRIPNSVMIFARPQNQVLINGVGGFSPCFVPDAFAAIQSIEININGETVLSNSDPSQLWKCSVENGCVDSYVQWSGSPVLKSVVTNPATYSYPSASVLKLVFNKDIMLKNGNLVPGTLFRTNFQAIVNFNQQDFASVNNITHDYSLYCVFFYDDLLTLAPDNLGTIQYGVLTEGDVARAPEVSRAVHFDIMRNHQISGAGIVDHLSNIVTHGKRLYPLIKAAYNSPLGHVVRNKVKSYLTEKGYPTIVKGLEAVGFGGAHASHHRLKKNLLKY